MEALTRLKQISYVVVYKAQFEVWTNRLKGLSEKYKLSYFLSGLRDQIRFHVRMLSPINLSVTFGLTKIQEEYILSFKKA